MGKKLWLDEVSGELRISKRSVRLLISSGQLRAVRIGSNDAANRMIRIDVDDIAKLADAIQPERLKAFILISAGRGRGCGCGSGCGYRVAPQRHCR